MFTILKPVTNRLRSSILFRNTLWFLSGNGVRLVLQAVYFVVIARALGVAQYGAFIGAVALMALITPFSSWGTGFILIKNVVRDRTKFARYWGAAFSLTIIAGALLVVLVVVLSHLIWVKSLPVEVLALVGVSDVICVRVLELCAQAFTAIELLRRNAELYIVLSVARTFAALTFVAIVNRPTATSWAVLYLLSSVVATLYGVIAVVRAFGLPSLRIRLSYAEIKEGFYFAVAQVSQTIYNDIDKTMLVRFSGLDATGVYGAAYRIVDVSFAPVGALVYSAFPRFFKHGEQGLSESVRLAKRLIPYSAIYGLIAWACLYFAAPLLPSLLGKGFASATLALRWLSPLVFIKSIHYFLADSLTGAGFQALRTVVQFLVVIVNILFNLWLIPGHSWVGAAWASLISDASLALGLLVVIGLVLRHARLRGTEVFQSTTAV